MNVSVQELGCLQSQQNRIRNISIMAHVDHGKTTLSDQLIASNGLIHPKLVGELRYLDSKEEEQIRGITMKSSSISLLYVPGAATSQQGPNSVTMEDKLKQGFLINLIDSPGHVDFCSEVSTAARLTDGCLIIVDAVEGVCIQTHAVLRQAWEEKVHPCLVINKIDRLILMLNLSPMEAYERLQQIITHVNMIMSAFESEKFLSEANAVLAHEDAKEAAAREDAQKVDVDGLDDAVDLADLTADVEDMFDPCKGNVVFGSAIFGWAFRIQQFAEMYAEKLGASAKALVHALWGDYYFQPRTKMVVRKKAAGGKLKPMFVQFILEPIWNAYSACEPGADVAGILGKIIKGRGLTRLPKNALHQKDPKQAIKVVLGAWLPLSEAVLGMVIDHLPSPEVAAPERISRLMSFPHLNNESAQLKAGLASTQSALMKSDQHTSAPLVIYVSKMIAVPVAMIPRQPGEPFLGDPTGEVFLAFGRVFSGIARAGLRVHVLTSAYNPCRPNEHRQTSVLGKLFLMMGRGLEQLDAVPAGNVLAISGLDQAISKSATLCSSPVCPPLVPMTFQSAAIVRVAIEPKLPSQMHVLETGLSMLSKADPFVEVEVLDSGEHVLGAAGEVHLETCIKDLKERFAKIDLEVSPPLVAFRETVFHQDEATDGVVGRPVRIVEASTPTGVCSIRVKACPIARQVASVLVDSVDLVKSVMGQDTVDKHNADLIKERLNAVLKEVSSENEALMKRAWMLGPKRVGPNALLAKNVDGPSLFDAPPSAVIQLDKKQNFSRPAKVGTSSAEAARKLPEGTDEEDDFDEEERSTLSSVSVQVPKTALDVEFQTPVAAIQLGLTPRPENVHSEKTTNPIHSELPENWNQMRVAIESGIISGFQLSTATGPLCDEPLWGVAFEIEARLFCPVRTGAMGQHRLDLGEEVYGPFTGQVMTVVNAACRHALLACDPRLAEAYYLCEISTSAEALSGVYAVLGRRRSRILREEAREGSDMFAVHAYLPVEASFGLAAELRKKSSGAASASLLLSHWERLQVDPFFVPITEEEREEFGEDGQLTHNLAKSLIDGVRRRKGLVVEEKVVESATKQRTRARKV